MKQRDATVLVVWCWIDLIRVTNENKTHFAVLGQLQDKNFLASWR